MTISKITANVVVDRKWKGHSLFGIKYGLNVKLYQANDLRVKMY